MLLSSLQNIHWGIEIQIKKHAEPIYCFIVVIVSIINNIITINIIFWRRKLVLVTIDFLTLNKVNE